MALAVGDRVALKVSAQQFGEPASAPMAGTSIQARTPRRLFQIPAGSNTLGVTGDLKHFLIPVPVEQKIPSAFTVMLNWTSLIKSRTIQ